MERPTIGRVTAVRDGDRDPVIVTTVVSPPEQYQPQQNGDDIMVVNEAPTPHAVLDNVRPTTALASPIPALFAEFRKSQQEYARPPVVPTDLAPSAEPDSDPRLKELDDRMKETPESPSERSTDEDEVMSDGYGDGGRQAELPELSAAAEADVLDAWAKNNLDEDISELENVVIKVQDLKTLKGSTWLNDQVINFYRVLIQRRCDADPSLPKVWLARTNFYSTLKEGGYTKVKRWTKKVKPHIFDKLDLLVVPINLANAHWCCGAINFKQKRFELYDSMGVNDEHAFYGLMRQYLCDEWDAKVGKGPFDLDGWTNYNDNENTPRQDNCYDCGVFTSQFMRCLSAQGGELNNVPFNFSQQDMQYFRKRMAYELITSELLAE